jgi:hypothetical protein
MNDRTKGIKTASTCAQSHKPVWWTDSLETSWHKAKVEATQEWGKIVEGEKRVAERAEVEAMAFGHGARHAYREFQVWSDKLEAMLRADWKETGHDAECAWTKVSAAVKHGWQRGAAQPAVARPALVEPAGLDVH